MHKNNKGNAIHLHCTINGNMQ